MSNELKGWIATQMEMSLGFSDASLVDNIVKISDEAEAAAYLRNFFGEQSSMIQEYLRKRFPKQPNNRKPASKKKFESLPNRNNNTPQLHITHKKKGKRRDKNANIVEAPKSRPKSPTQPQSAAALSAALFGTGDVEPEEIATMDIEEPVEEPEKPPEPVLQGKWAKRNKPPAKQVRDKDFELPEAYKPPKMKVQQRQRKKKYRNINEINENILLPGRHMCDCQAQKCDLIANCTECGRIICAQEGEGPCLFCGNYVAASGQLNITDEKLLKAVEHKDRLLDYDRQSARRTQVIDDETDYYKGVDEEKIREHRHASRLDKKFTLNLKTETLDEQTTEQFIDQEAKNVVKVDQERLNMKEQLFYNEDLQSNRFIFDLQNKSDLFKETEIIREVVNWSKPAANLAQSDRSRRPIKSRVQDERLKEMFDSGTCLTMHQPWASLLIKGVKIHEGRVWNTEHRGRLWIHASSKTPDPEICKSQLAEYGMTADEFDNWPTGCLLGFCTVTDVLPQEQYRQQHPDGPSQAPFVFLCEDTHELEFKAQVSGQHKLWKLPRDVHQSARSQLNL